MFYPNFLKKIHQINFKTLFKYIVKKSPLKIKKNRKQEYNFCKSNEFWKKNSNIKQNIMDDNIIQFLISFANVAPIKIPSN